MSLIFVLAILATLFFDAVNAPLGNPFKFTTASPATLLNDHEVGPTGIPIYVVTLTSTTTIFRTPPPSTVTAPPVTTTITAAPVANTSATAADDKLKKMKTIFDLIKAASEWAAMIGGWAAFIFFGQSGSKRLGKWCHERVRGRFASCPRVTSCPKLAWLAKGDDDDTHDDDTHDDDTHDGTLPTVNPAAPTTSTVAPPPQPPPAVGLTLLPPRTAARRPNHQHAASEPLPSSPARLAPSRAAPDSVPNPPEPGPAQDQGFAAAGPSQ